MGSAAELGEREIGVIASTDELARDGCIVEPQGVDLTAYRRNPIVLYNHNYEKPVGVCTAIGVEDGSLAARIQFAPAGVSADADLACALTKGAVLNAVSIGFMPKETEPLDPKQPWGGVRYLSADLLEISIVPVPADSNALVIARNFAQRPGALRLIRSLVPIRQDAVERVLSRFQPLVHRRSDGAIVGPNDGRPLHEVQREFARQVWANQRAAEVEHDARWSKNGRAARLAALLGRMH
jgi:HK97 family phage prohead protease